MNLNQVREVLATISFSPSCVDMGWEWETRDAWGDENEDSITLEHTGFLLRTTFQRPDRNTGVVSKGFGRWWHVPADVTESGVVKTAFAACKMILDHEIMESFLYEGVRLFDPHHTVEDLKEAVLRRAMVSR